MRIPYAIVRVTALINAFGLFWIPTTRACVGARVIRSDCGEIDPARTAVLNCGWMPTKPASIPSLWADINLAGILSG